MKTIAIVIGILLYLFFVWLICQFCAFNDRTPPLPPSDNNAQD